MKQVAWKQPVILTGLRVPCKTRNWKRLESAIMAQRAVRPVASQFGFAEFEFLQPCMVSESELILELEVWSAIAGRKAVVLVKE